MQPAERKCAAYVPQGVTEVGVMHPAERKCAAYSSVPQVLTTLFPGVR